MSVTAPSSTANTPTVNAPGDTSTAARIPQKTLGQSDFLKLITVQLSKQDPLKPMDDTGFIAQMAQFTSLQQTNQLVSQFTDVRSASDLSSASALIGRQVTVSTKAGDVTGQVSAVDTTGADPQIVINGTSYGLATLKRVEPAPVPTTPSS
jgi:flagellar basal-body rod modification protein FlgD